MILTIYTNYLIYLSVYLINIFKEKILKVYFSLGIENNLLLFWLELLFIRLMKKMTSYFLIPSSSSPHNQSWLAH